MSLPLIHRPGTVRPQVAYGRVGSLVPPNRQRSRQPCSVILRPSILRLFDSPCWPSVRSAGQRITPV